MVNATRASATRATTPPSPRRAKTSHHHLVSARPAISNRHKMQLESSVTSRKQTTAPNSNRHRFCPKSAPAPRPPAATTQNSPITAPKSATVSSHPLFPFSVIATQILDIEPIRSQQTRKHFLIARFSGISAPTPDVTNHYSRTESFLFDTNKTPRIIILIRTLMKTKEKRFSIRYKFALRGIGNLACALRLWVGVLQSRSEQIKSAQPRLPTLPLNFHDAEVGLCSLTCRSYGKASRMKTAASAPTTRSAASA
jgi:hypothetical protein